MKTHFPTGYVSELRRVKQRRGDGRLKAVVADLTLDQQMLQGVLEKRWRSPSRSRQTEYLVDLLPRGPTGGGLHADAARTREVRVRAFRREVHEACPLTRMMVHRPLDKNAVRHLGCRSMARSAQHHTLVGSSAVMCTCREPALGALHAQLTRPAP